MLEMRHAITEFYRTFTTGVKLSTADGFSEDDMQQVVWFLGNPKGGRCLVESLPPPRG